MQRLHQYASLKEIAEKLEKELVVAQELKDFLSNICCESYPDVEQFKRDRQMLEDQFPTYSEHSEAQGSNTWGAWKLGRIPAFLYDDARTLHSRSSVSLRFAQKASGISRSAPTMSIMGHIDDWIDGARFKSLFQKAFQYFQSRCQHHIHKLVNGKRIVPNACRSKCKPKECKHEAPWTNRVAPEWMTKPLLICEGLAKKFKLRCSGVRNWMGQMLLVRNEAWVNGTMPGLCVAFAGSNSDVKPNDRLPITECVHEQVCGKRRCLVRKNKLKRTMIATQRTQSVTNGYFGGYIGKRQPAGALATRKCMGKLFTLRAKYKGKSRAAQLRAASGRLITDIEMNSSYRGAVELFHLCRNLHPYDVLFAECVRTFLDLVLDGRSWMYRLETWTMEKVFKNACLQNYVPSTKRPNVRTDRAKVNECDAYGYRPLLHPWKLLSAYEFLRYWRVVPLLSPTYYYNKGVKQRTVWTAEGRKVIQRSEYKDGQISLKPGVHYIAVESVSNEYYLFPEEPFDIYKIFRHSWALERNPRPYVVVTVNPQFYKESL